MSYYYVDKRNSRELVTPEGIDLQIRLASIGSRFGALCIDLFLIYASIILFIVLLVFGFSALGADVDTANIMVTIGIFVTFIIRNFYFMFFEMGPKAATPGKRLMKIRVAARRKALLSGNAVFTRNALREIEIFLPIQLMFSNLDGVDGMINLLAFIWCSVFMLFALFNKDKLRAGDLIAGTWVIQSPKPMLANDLADDANGENQNFIFTPDQVEAYGIHELHVLEDVLRARDQETMIDVAKRIRKKIDWKPSLSETDEAFLKAYYAALRGRLETRLLFGVRRKNKHDTR